MHEHMELVFLGTGASWPSVERNVAAVAVKRGSEIVLFDCGEGTQRQFQRSKLSYMQVTKLFVTHLHGDHYLGVTGLIQTMRLNERDVDLDVYGPRGTKALMDKLLSLGRSRGGFRVHVHEIEDGAVVACDGYEVRARAVHHTAPALAYRLQEHDRPGRFDKARALELGVPEGRAFGQLQRGVSVTTPAGATVTPADVLGPARRGRSIVYTGDCVPGESTVELAAEADVLVHEATYASDFTDANVHGHSTAAQAAFMASRAQVGRLFLTHFSPRYGDVRPLVAEARAVFAESYEARDLLEFLVRFPNEEEKDEQAVADIAPQA